MRGGSSDEETFFEEFSDWIDGTEDYYSFDAEDCRKFVKGCITEAEFDQLYHAAMTMIAENEDWYGQ